MAEVEARVVVKEFVPAVTRRQRRVSTLDERRGRPKGCKKGAKRVLVWGFHAVVTLAGICER